MNDWLEVLKADLLLDGYSRKEIDAHFALTSEEQREIDSKKAEWTKQGYSNADIKCLLEPFYEKILWQRIKALE